MFPVGVYLFLAFIDINLMWYAMFEKGADYYKDLMALAIATTMTFYMAVAAVSGSVQLSTSTVMHDPALMWIGIIIGVAQAFILVIEIIETVQDYYAQRMQRLIS